MTRRTRVKFCGITDERQARAACEAGADAIGLVFHGGSSRVVDAARAARICREVAPFVTVVGLFVDPQPALVREVLGQCALDQLQFHGDEDAAFCTQFDRPYIKALRMRPGIDLAAGMRAHPDARAFLLDAYRRGVPGGTGATFDWSRIPPLTRPWALAGGLTPDNVGAAIAAVRPPAVDVSGGVESAPGIKDPALLQRFAAAVRRAEHTRLEDAV